MGRCPYGQTFECASEWELAMKHRIHCRFCSKPPVPFVKVEVPKKAMTMGEHNSLMSMKG